MKETIKIIESATVVAQQLIKDLYLSEPDNSTLTQVGILDGQEIVMGFINVDEYGCALDHLLYMIHESDIPFPRTVMLELHKISKLYNLENHYSKENQAHLTPEQMANVFNAP